MGRVGKAFHLLHEKQWVSRVDKAFPKAILLRHIFKASPRVSPRCALSPRHQKARRKINGLGFSIRLNQAYFGHCAVTFGSYLSIVV